MNGEFSLGKNYQITSSVTEGCEKLLEKIKEVITGLLKGGYNVLMRNHSRIPKGGKTTKKANKRKEAACNHEQEKRHKDAQEN